MTNHNGYCIFPNSVLSGSCLRQMVSLTATATGHYSLLEASSNDQIQSQIRQTGQQRLFTQMVNNGISQLRQPDVANAMHSARPHIHHLHAKQFLLHPRLPGTCHQPPIRYNICKTRPTSLSSTVHRTPKPPYPSATLTQTSLEILMTENQHLAMYSCFPEVLLPGVLVSSHLSLSQRWKPNT